VNAVEQEAAESAIRVVELATGLEIVPLRDSPRLVTSVVDLITCLAIVSGEEVVETLVEEAGLVSTATRKVTLQGIVLLLDCFSLSTKEIEDEFE
jgi:hypothetical protein